MARVAEAVIERIKSEVSLLRMAQSQGYAVKRQGKDYALCCPFHEDKTPSCVITPAKNLFNCFGCGASGSVIDWVMRTKAMSFRAAVEWLQKDMSAAPFVEAAVVSTVKALAELPAHELLRDVVNYYHETLLQSPDSLNYLQARGLDDAELIQHFALGFANRTLCYRLSNGDNKTAVRLRSALRRVGVLRESGHEHLNGSLVIPLRNLAGEWVQLYGRKIRDDLREGTAYHLYLPHAHAGVFNGNYLQKNPSEEIILCEALIDALTFWRCGFRHVTSAMGVNGFTDELLSALEALNIKRVLIAFDGDSAGDTGAEKIAQQLKEKQIDAYRVVFPQGVDANAYALRDLATAPHRFTQLLHNAQPLAIGEGHEAHTISMLPLVVDAQPLMIEPQPLPLTSSSVAHATELPPIIEAELMAEPTAPIEESPKEKEKKETIEPAQKQEPAIKQEIIEELEQRDDGLYLIQGERDRSPREYRIRGLDANTDHDQLKIQLLVRRGEAFFIDKLDLYSSKQRQIFINQACVELAVKEDVIKRDLGRVLLLLEQAQLKKKHQQAAVLPEQSMSAQEREAALALLRDEHLAERILSDFALAGVVGEETNKLVGYLACVSRQLDKPLAVVIQSSSAAGKSSLMDAVLAFMPEDERVQYSAMTGQSLFYMGETRLKHKILAISEEEGAHTASYALKLLQSEGEVTIASTGKDDASGQLVTREYKVEGPVMLFLTTTAIDIDEELMNRCLVLTVNESREQTEAIHRAQRLKRTLQGLETKLHKAHVIQLHRNAQRLLKPLAVINPYADQLTFLSDKTRTRRDHEKYLTLIDSIALLHQYQRHIKNLNGVKYIEVIPADIELANRIAHDVLGKTLDELPPQTRKLLTEIYTWVSQSCTVDGIAQRDFRFTRKHIREVTGWGNTQLKIHCGRLEDMEYLLIHRGGRGQAVEYELLYQGEGEKHSAFMLGLLNASELTRTKKIPVYDLKVVGVSA